MNEMTIEEMVAVCDRMVAALEENGYSTGYAEDLGIGLGEYLYYHDEDNVSFKFTSRSPECKKFEIDMDSEFIEDALIEIGHVRGGMYEVSIERFEKELMECINK